MNHPSQDQDAESRVIRIAIIIEREEASVMPLALPFSVIGYPLVEVEFFSGGGPPKPLPPPNPHLELQPEALRLGLVSEKVLMPVRKLSDLIPRGFDLILDWQNRTAGLPQLTSESLPHLVTGPGIPYLEKILCQFQEVRQKHEINANILINAADGIVTIDENHSIIAYNYGAEKIFGYTRQQALGQDLSLIIPPPHKEMHREYVRRFIATRQPRFIGKHVQLSAQRQDGAEFPMSISFSVANINGRLYFTGIIRDISEYKRMEERLLQSERLATIGNTVSHIAHEIKNPLAVIGGFARQLARTPGLTEKSQKKLTIITQEVERLEAMIAEMRDFVRLPAPRKSPGNLDRLLNEVLEFFQESFQDHHIRVHEARQKEMPEVNFDPEQMRQLLINLIKNAIEAMPEGGDLTLTTRLQGEQVEVSITDTGRGMTPEVKAKIFQPYFTTKEKGTGLGLAICQNIAQEHGGCLLADSAPGQGSTFTIQIPLEDRQP